MAENNIVGGIFTALGAGLAGAAGQEDQFLKMMEMMKEGKKPTESDVELLRGKAQLQAQGYDVSGITDLDGMYAVQGTIAQNESRFASREAAWQETVDAQRGLLSEAQSSTNPLNEDWHQAWVELERQEAKDWGALQQLSGPQPDRLNPYMRQRTRLLEDYQSVGTRSDHFGAAPLIANKDFAGANAALASLSPQGLDTAQSNTVISGYWGRLQKAHEALGQMSRRADGTFYGSGQAIAAREALTVKDPEHGEYMMSWQEASQNEEALNALAKVGDAASFAQTNEQEGSKQRAREAAKSFIDFTGRLFGGTNVKEPDTYINPSTGEFEADRVIDDVLEDRVANTENLNEDELVELLRDINVMEGSVPEAQQQRVRDYKERVGGALGRQIGGPNDPVSSFLGALSRQYQDEIQAALRFELPETFDDLVGPVIPTGEQRENVFSRDPSLMMDMRGTARLPRPAPPRLAKTVEERIQAVEIKRESDPEFARTWGALPSGVREAFIQDGRVTRMMRGPVLTESFSDALTVPLEGLPGAFSVPLGEAKKTAIRSSVAMKDISAEASAAYELEAAEIGAREQTYDLVRQGVQNMGEYVRVFEGEGAEGLAGALVSDMYPTLTPDVGGGGSTLPQQTRLGLDRLEERLKNAPNAMTRGRLFLEMYFNAHKQGIRQTMSGEVASAAEAAAEEAFAYALEAYDRLVEEASDQDITEEELAEQLGADSPDTWFLPLFREVGTREQPFDVEADSRNWFQKAAGFMFPGDKMMYER